MDKFKTDNPNDNQSDRNKSNDVVRVSKKNNPADDRSSSAYAGPYSIRSTDGYAFHWLGNAKETEYNKNNGDDARDKSAKSLTKF